MASHMLAVTLSPRQFCADAVVFASARAITAIQESRAVSAESWLSVAVAAAAATRRFARLTHRQQITLGRLAYACLPEWQARELLDRAARAEIDATAAYSGSDAARMARRAAHLFETAANLPVVLTDSDAKTLFAQFAAVEYIAIVPIAVEFSSIP